MGWPWSAKVITSGEELDEKWKKRVIVRPQVLTCHKCGTQYELKPGAPNCPECGHSGDTQDCRACDALRCYTGR